MSKQLKISKLLQKLNDILMECSNIEDDVFYDCESKPKENEIELFNSENSNNEVINKENVQEYSESEFKNILNLCKKKRIRMLSNSENGNENILQDHQNEIAADGINWEKI
ncbi:hypothetical protein HZH68_011723 [Vespula germanica]|uniref:Uncharacterized protein n=1 Tax=Vespula germanica TaxID=30212 RepID=A0A834JQU5_VESGE|nr:hypothetical protein HZH68_011723 [Vespula germanica]